MEHNPEYLPAFKNSKIYIKLLQELDLLQQTSNEYDNISLNSDENLEITITESKTEIPFLQITKPLEDEEYLCISDNNTKNQRHMRSFSDVDVVVFTEEDKRTECRASSVERASSNENLRTENYVLVVKIIETGKNYS